jgi:HlyD family secretion protein
MTDTAAERPKRRTRRRIWWIIAVLLLIGGIAGSRLMIPEQQAGGPATIPVQQGEFIISLDLNNGEMEAIKSEQINAPQVHGQLKITELFPEGERVEVGDLVVRFDPSEFQQRVTDAQQQLEGAKAELEKNTANQEVNIAALESEIENKKSELRMSELQIEKMKFESSISKDEAELRAKQAVLALEQAKKKLAAQLIVDGAQQRQQELTIDQRQRNYDKALKDHESLAVHAEKPGIVVYEKMWKGGKREKIRVGDEPWGGATLVKLPDLTRMQVKTAINEVNVDRLKVGQPATIKLAALPEPTFHGTVTSIATLGHEKEDDKKVKVFDVTIDITEEDERLKPGMSAACQVVIETIPPPPPAATDSIQQESAELPAESPALPLYVPLDAIFEKNGRTVVFRRLESGEMLETEVTLGKKNEDYVIVESGLGPDDRISLRDPSLNLEALGGVPKNEATTASSVQ